MVSLVYRVLPHLISEPQQGLTKSGNLFLKAAEECLLVHPFTRPHGSALPSSLPWPELLLSQCSATYALSLQTGQNGTDNILWPLCKTKSFYRKANIVPCLNVATLITFSKIESYVGEKPGEAKVPCQNKGKFAKMF